MNYFSLPSTSPLRFISVFNVWNTLFATLITEAYMENLSARIFATHLQEQEALHINYLHRKSAASSIRRVYQTLKDNTSKQIQTLSHKIMCILQPGIQTAVEDPIEVLTSLTDRDDLVQELTQTFCTLKRSSWRTQICLTFGLFQTVLDNYWTCNVL